MLDDHGLWSLVFYTNQRGQCMHDTNNLCLSHICMKTQDWLLFSCENLQDKRHLACVYNSIYNYNTLLIQIKYTR